MPSAADAERAFVDTNVLVYSVDRSEPRKRERARGLLSGSGATTLVISTQVLSEFYVVTTRRLSAPLAPAQAATAVAAFSKLAVVAVDTDLVLSAIVLSGRSQLSYWDALIVAAAHGAGCPVVLTEDLGGGQVIDGVLVENPFEDI